MGEADFRTFLGDEMGRFARQSEISVQRRRRVTTRVVAVLAMIAPAALAVSGCSPGADYPSIFPAVHDMPPPRADTPMDANQVQQATEDLITDRNRLSAEAQGTGQSATTGTSTVKKPAAADGSATTQNAGGNGAQTVGTETK
jgi:hypothetical protein